MSELRPPFCSRDFPATVEAASEAETWLARQASDMGLGEEAEFADDGAPFDPTTAPAKRINGPTQDFDIGGYGTGLMQKFSRRMSYSRFEGMNRLVLEFDAGRNANAGPDTLSAP
jgi:hypothetical protein